jgi:hypothetical protein
MREINPCRTVEQARVVMDNGGHFYNVLTRAGDRVVTQQELEKAARSSFSGADLFLFLELLLSEMGGQERAEVVELLEPQVRSRYLAERPVELSPAELDRRGEANEAVIVTGTLTEVGVIRRKTGTMLIAPVAGSVEAAIAVPVDEDWRLYRISTTAGEGGARTLLAVPSSVAEPPPGVLRVGGVLRPRDTPGEPLPDSDLFLEASYFVAVEPSAGLGGVRTPT